MTTTSKTMMVLGGSGFIGRHVIETAIASGWHVKALARSDDAAAAIAASGGSVVRGEAAEPRAWANALIDVDVVVDLVQPARAKRLGRRAMRRISAQRQTFMRALVRELDAIDAARRPRLLSVSGIDDLAPDRDGCLSGDSPLRANESGFNTIGLPVRAIVEGSALDASFAYLGTVYGPGGVFAREIFPAVAAGTWKNFGGPADRMILVHVHDVARGLVRIAELDRARAGGSTFVLTDMEPVTMGDFFRAASTLMGVRAPGSVPAWMAALVAGRPIVETTLHREPVRPSFAGLGERLAYPSYRDGLPPTLRALGNAAGG